MYEICVHLVILELVGKYYTKTQNAKQCMFGCKLVQCSISDYRFKSRQFKLSINLYGKIPDQATTSSRFISRSPYPGFGRSNKATFIQPKINNRRKNPNYILFELLRTINKRLAAQN